MSTWGKLLKELGAIQVPPNSGLSAHDILRRQKLKDLHRHTGRAVIVYATAYLEAKEGLQDQMVSVGLGDIHGLMETCHNINEKELDLVIHSPGGSAEAADAFVGYLRTRFDHIRVIVPLAAMSAATMIALGGDEIYMGAHSQLGPIDPQFTILTPEGPRTAPSQAIKDQFRMAKRDCAKHPNRLPAWLPILRGYAPGLLAQCDYQRKLGEEFVARWLEAYMFRGEPDAADKAKNAAAWFADFKTFKSHGRRVSRDDARQQGIKVVDLEADQTLQDLYLAVFHAYQLTLSQTPAGKIIENHNGKAVVQMVQVIRVTPSPAPQPPPSPAPQPGPPVVMPGQLPLNRNQRRAQERGKR